MIKKNIMGIYAEDNVLHYAYASRELTGWTPKIVTSTKKSFGIIERKQGERQSTSLLTTFLNDITISKRTQFYLGLPREMFFVRNLNIPVMPLEDALEVAKNTLPLSCHLAIEEIYYDISICAIKDGLNVLVIYADKKTIDPYLSCFKNAGLQKSLKAVFPISFGIGAWLKINGYPLPVGVRLKQKENEELVVFGTNGTYTSIVWPYHAGQEKAVIAEVISKFPEVNNEILYFNDKDLSIFSLLSSNNQLGRLSATAGNKNSSNVISYGGFQIKLNSSSYKDNMGIFALSGGISPLHTVSTDAHPPRVKVFKPLWVIIPLFLIFFLFAYVMTDYMENNLIKKKQEIVVLKKGIRSLKNRLKPLEEKNAAEKNAAEFMTDVNDFVNAKPDIFSLINGIAKVIPEKTWFTRFVYVCRKMTFEIHIDSPSALETIDKLRSLDFFEQVKLSGTVSRSKSGNERFQVRAKLKELYESP